MRLTSLSQRHTRTQAKDHAIPPFFSYRSHLLSNKHPTTPSTWLPIYQLLAIPCPGMTSLATRCQTDELTRHLPSVERDASLEVMSLYSRAQSIENEVRSRDIDINLIIEVR